MRPRAYALTLMSAGTGLFLSVVATNLIIDPQSVFGTNLLPRSANLSNHHYQRLIAYQAAPDRYDGVLFGSSRAPAIPLDELSRRMDGANFASFWVAGGMLPDHLPALEYILRDKSRRGQRLRAVFLLLDVDAFGDEPGTNQSIQTLLPPALSGEIPLRFWWKNLVSLQPDTWRRAIRAARARSQPAEGAAATTIHTVQGALAAVTDAASAGMARRGALPRPLDPEVKAMQPIPFAQRAHISEQLRLLERMQLLCHENGTALVVAISPLHRVIESLYDPSELSQVIDRIAGVVPVWDFTRSDWLSDDPALWVGDNSHFDALVSRMMLRRIFGEDVPDRWKNFGRLTVGFSEGTSTSAQ